MFTYFPIVAPALFLRQVRDIYEAGDYMVLVTTDRQSAFDRVLASVPFKGQASSLTPSTLNPWLLGCCDNSSVQTHTRTLRFEN